MENCTLNCIYRYSCGLGFRTNQVKLRRNKTYTFVYAVSEKSVKCQEVSHKLWRLRTEKIEMPLLSGNLAYFDYCFTCSWASISQKILQRMVFSICFGCQCNRKSREKNVLGLWQFYERAPTVWLQIDSVKLT